MRISKVFTLLLIALLCALPEIVEAGRSRRSNRPLNLARSYSSRTYSSGGGGSRRGSPTWYYGIITIPREDGTYFEGYGEECPGGCAIDRVCETEERCNSVARTNYFWFGVGVLIIVVTIWTICNDPKCCGKKPKDGSEKSGSHSHHSSARNSVH